MQLENKIRYDRSMLPDLAALIAGPLLSERTIALAGQPTRITLETIVWEGFEEAARRQGRTIAELCGELEIDMDIDTSMDTAIRTYVLNFFREAARL